MNEAISLCSSCETVCGLEQLARRIEDQLPIATIEAGLRQGQLDATGARAENLELEQLASDTVHDELGIRVDEPNPEEYIGALDDHLAALDAASNDRTYMLRASGPGWVARARSLATECIQFCDGPRRGFRIPLTSVVVPLPGGAGRVYCGSELQDRAEFHMGLAEIGIDQGLEALEATE